ncbi:hypothetical protein TNCV_148651 [Trichonephila clavipes]|nr:hypothetical protein TNCV_148651 [Trichonephila clavipes]
MAEKDALHLLTTEEQKYYVSEKKEFHGHPLKIDLSHVCVSVSSKTIRSRLADVGLKGRIPRKKQYLIHSSARRDYCGQWNTLIGQMIIGHKLYRGTKLKYVIR